jgi:SnoaL-like domain
LPLHSRIRQSLVRYWVRRSYEIVNRRDFELALAAQDADVLISWTGDPSGGIAPDLIDRDFRGHDGFKQAWNTWLEAFEDLRVEPQRSRTSAIDCWCALTRLGAGRRAARQWTSAATPSTPSTAVSSSAMSSSSTATWQRREPV